MRLFTTWGPREQDPTWGKARYSLGKAGPLGGGVQQDLPGEPGRCNRPEEERGRLRALE